MARLITIPIGVLVFGLSMFSCGGDPMRTAEMSGHDNLPKVAIIVRESPFKDKLVRRFVEGYGQTTALTIMDISELNDFDENGYDALVVMGARMGFLMFSVKERHFLRKLHHPEKLVLLMTAAASDWEWDRDDVDVISGASATENLDPLYTEMRQKLDAILAR